MSVAIALSYLRASAARTSHSAAVCARSSAREDVLVARADTCSLIRPSYPPLFRGQGARRSQPGGRKYRGYGVGVGLGEAGGTDGDPDGAAVGRGVGLGDGEGSGGHPAPSFGARVMTRVTPFSSISFDSWPGAQTSAVWPTMSTVVTTTWPQGSAVHFASTVVPWRTS